MRCLLNLAMCLGLASLIIGTLRLIPKTIVTSEPRLLVRQTWEWRGGAFDPSAYGNLVREVDLGDRSALPEPGQYVLILTDRDHVSLTTVVVGMPREEHGMLVQDQSTLPWHTLTRWGLMWRGFVLLVASALLRYVWFRNPPREGEPPCPNCGYDLRGSPGPVCPECGCPMDRKRCQS